MYTYLQTIMILLANQLTWANFISHTKKSLDTYINYCIISSYCMLNCIQLYDSLILADIGICLYETVEQISVGI